MSEVILVSNVEPNTFDTLALDTLPDTSFGTNTIITIGTAFGATRHAFCQIDPSAKIPLGSTVNFASMWPYVGTASGLTDQEVRWYTFSGPMNDTTTWNDRLGVPLPLPWNPPGGEWVDLITKWILPTTTGWKEITGFGPALQAAVDEGRSLYFGARTDIPILPNDIAKFWSQSGTYPWYISADVTLPRHPHYYNRRRR